MQFGNAWAHVRDIVIDRSVVILKGADLSGVFKENFVISATMEGRIDIDEIDAAGGKVR